MQYAVVFKNKGLLGASWRYLCRRIHYRPKGPSRKKYARIANCFFPTDDITHTLHFIFCLAHHHWLGRLTSSTEDQRTPNKPTFFMKHFF